MLNVFLAQLENTVLYVQDRECFNILFMVLSLLLSALLSDLIFRDDKKLLKKIIITYVAIIAIVIFVSLGVVAWLFQVELQQGSFCYLLFRIAKVNGKDYLLPLLASFIAGILIKKWIVTSERRAKGIFCVVVGFSAVVSSIVFFLNAFQLVQRPNYNVPTEAVASVVNSRLNVYPMALSGKDLKEIEERHKSKPKTTEPNGDSRTDETDDGQKPDIPEPTSFSEYVSVAINTIGTEEQEAYLRRAYQLFSAGRHDDDYFSIGVMWNLLAYVDWFQNASYKECLHNSIEAYQKCEERGNASQALYTNMMIIYDLLKNVDGTRSCLRKALKLGENGAGIQSQYQSYVYQWMETEELDVLMKDAGVIIDYSVNHKSKLPIAICVLYAACAADRNKNISQAYRYLSDADKQYKGNDPMVKILKCICGDILGIDATGSLPAIYKLEEKLGRLSSVEELYLIRYLHAAGRYDELWGYIADVGAAMSDSGERGDSDNPEISDAPSDTGVSSGSDASDELEELEDADIEKAAIKAEWYFKNWLSTSDNVKGAEKLHDLISNRLQRGELDEKDEKILRLSQLLLSSCLGIAETADLKSVDAKEIEEVSDIAYVFLAVNAFNEEKYKKAVSYCDKFFDAEKNLKKKSTISTSGFSLKKLEAQEQVVLHYHMQLIYAHSHFEFAKTTKKGSKEWNAYMDKAKEICIDFENSSKSLFMIREQFHILRGSIDFENGEINNNEDEKTTKEQNF